MSNYITKDELAKIAISKNLIKEYKSSDSERTVYLNDGTEFQIYLKNPYRDHLGIKIYVNDKSIGNMLVLKPGQSCWLDRFVDENKRFLFSTYEVENTHEMRYAINKNGRVKIEFYHEREDRPYSTSVLTVTTPKTNFDWRDYTITCSDTYTSINTCCYSSLTGDMGTPIQTAANSSASTASFTVDKSDLSLETGRVEKGSASHQEFESCDIDFEYYPFKTENILILPSSRKQVRVEETRRRYCSQCGKKVSPKDKFCSNCGAKLI